MAEQRRNFERSNSGSCGQGRRAAAGRKNGSRQDSAEGYGRSYKDGQYSRKSRKNVPPESGKVKGAARGYEAMGPRHNYLFKKEFGNERELVLKAQRESEQIAAEERLEGRNAVAEALRAGRAFNKVWYLKPLEGKSQDHRLFELITQLRDTEAVLYPVDRKTLDRMAQTPSHQGIIAQAAAHEYAEIEDILTLAKARGEKPFLLLLDQIQDSQNLGAIMRTADAAGAHGVVITRRRSVALDAAAAKASAGAVEHVLCARVTNLNATIAELKAQNIWVVGLAMEGEPIQKSTVFNEGIALVIGSEGSGLSALVEQNCDALLSIPMYGKINSLNASNAAAIAMYEVVRKRQEQN